MELDECLEEVEHVITCLHKLSMTIQNPATLQEPPSIDNDISRFEHSDIQRISNTFPGAEFYLVQRLGRSNARRRQLLRCRERHHRGVPSQCDPEPPVPMPSYHRDSESEQGKGDKPRAARPENEHDDDQESGKKGTETYAPSGHTVMSYERRGGVASDELSDTGSQRPSYSSPIHGADEMLCVPPPPNRDRAFHREAFQCPYCFTIITVPNQNIWKYARMNHSQNIYPESNDTPESISLATSDHTFALSKTASNLITSLTTATTGSSTKLKCTAESIFATFATGHRLPVPTSRDTFGGNIRNCSTLTN